LYSNGLRQIFDLFSRNIQDFLKENLEFSKSDNSSEYRFLNGTFYHILSHLAFLESFQNWFKFFLAPEFLKEFQNLKMRLEDKISAF
jgi:hypothetical protein